MHFLSSLGFFGGPGVAGAPASGPSAVQLQRNRKWRPRSNATNFRPTEVQFQAMGPTQKWRPRSSAAMSSVGSDTQVAASSSVTNFLMDTLAAEERARCIFDHPPACHTRPSPPTQTMDICSFSPKCRTPHLYAPPPCTRCSAAGHSTRMRLLSRINQSFVHK